MQEPKKPQKEYRTSQDLFNMSDKFYDSDTTCRPVVVSVQRLMDRIQEVCPDTPLGDIEIYIPGGNAEFTAYTTRSNEKYDEEMVTWRQEHKVWRQFRKKEKNEEDAERADGLTQEIMRLRQQSDEISVSMKKLAEKRDKLLRSLESGS